MLYYLLFVICIQLVVRVAKAELNLEINILQFLVKLTKARCYTWHIMLRMCKL